MYIIKTTSSDIKIASAFRSTMTMDSMIRLFQMLFLSVFLVSVALLGMLLVRPFCPDFPKSNEPIIASLLSLNILIHFYLSAIGLAVLSIIQDEYSLAYMMHLLFAIELRPR